MVAFVDRSDCEASRANVAQGECGRMLRTNEELRCQVGSLQAALQERKSFQEHQRKINQDIERTQEERLCAHTEAMSVLRGERDQLLRDLLEERNNSTKLQRNLNQTATSSKDLKTQNYNLQRNLTYQKERRAECIPLNAQLEPAAALRDVVDKAAKKKLPNSYQKTREKVISDAFSHVPLRGGADMFRKSMDTDDRDDADDVDMVEEEVPMQDFLLRVRKRSNLSNPMCFLRGMDMRGNLNCEAVDALRDIEDLPPHTKGIIPASTS